MTIRLAGLWWILQLYIALQLQGIGVLGARYQCSGALAKGILSGGGA